MIDWRFVLEGKPERVRQVQDAKTEGAAKKWAIGEAPRIIREVEEKRHQEKTEGTRSKVPTFAHFVEKQWLPIYPKAAGNRHTTIEEKKGHLKTHLIPFFGETRLDRIDFKQIQKFIATTLNKTKGKREEERTSRNGYLKAQKTISPKRVKNVVGTLRTILGSAVDWGDLPALPKFPRVKCPMPSFGFYDVSEVALLATSARDAEERALILFAAHSGARAGEQLAIEWTDLDFRRKLITFRRARTAGITVDSTKSNKPREVPMSPTLEAALKTHRHLRGPLVFCQHDEHASHLTIWHLHGALERAARRAQLRLLRWHDLRHSFASNLTIGGTPLRQVQEWLGHSSLTMVLRYAHLAPGGGREYLAALDVPAETPSESASQSSGKK
jgi:integrase